MHVSMRPSTIFHSQTVLPGRFPSILSQRLLAPRPGGRKLHSVQSTPDAPLDEPAQASPSLFSKLFRSLTDVGIGTRSLAEGAVGLFIIVGIGFSVALIAWARGSALRKGHPYMATIQFPQACGITVGTPVRIRGVQIGSVMNVKAWLDRVDVVVEVNDESTVIPRNSIVEANQSGLIAEPLVDITPILPIPVYSASPLSAACEVEQQVVCHDGVIQGQQGVALDDLVYICTKLARQMDQEGVSKIFAAAEAATAAIEEAKPLLHQATKLVEEITPLLQELNEGDLVGNVEDLTKAAAEAAADIQKLQSCILTEDNVKALRGAVITLCRTLEHAESISSDVSVFSRDSSVQRNLKTLIQALSRLVDE